MSKKTYLNILKFGALFTLVSVFLVYKDLLFPYITSKQITFNVFVEILLIFWIALIVKFPEERPKMSYITLGILAFLVVITISSIVGIDFNLSFWGDIERMLGVFHVIHFFGLYLIIITSFKKWSDWKLFFILSIILANLVSIGGLTHKEYSTIGNAAYVSAYIIFNIYFALILFFNDSKSDFKWLYLISLPLMLIEFNKLNTSGAIVGLGFSLMMMLFLYGVLNKNKKVRTATLSSFILLIIFIFAVFQNINSDFVKTTPFIKNLREINFQKNTFQTRLISWKAGIDDLKDHPVLGVGFGNFALIFDKHFEASFYNYTRTETYFDRAHNNVIDIMSTSGILGLVAYLTIFFAVIYYLFLAYRRKRISINEFIMLICLFTAYFVQNLAVFDSLVTYMMLMATLGYVYWISQREEEENFHETNLNPMQYVYLAIILIASVVSYSVSISTNPTPFFTEGHGRLFIFLLVLFFGGIIYIIWEGNKEGDAEVLNTEVLGISISILVLGFIIYQFNYLPLVMLQKTIDGQRVYSNSKGDLLETTITYKEALSHDTVLDRDSRTSYIRLVSQNANNLRKLSPADANMVINFAIQQSENNLAYNNRDSLNLMMHAQLNNLVAMYYMGDEEKFFNYSNISLEFIDRSIQSSPERVPIYYQKAQIYITREQFYLNKNNPEAAQKEKEEALNTLKFALSLNEKYYDSYCYLGKTLYLSGKQDDSYQYIDKCIDLRGYSLLSPKSFLERLMPHYIEEGNDLRLAYLFNTLANYEPKNAKYWIETGKYYGEAGENKKAISAVQKAMELDPSIVQYGQDFINRLMTEQ